MQIVTDSGTDVNLTSAEMEELKIIVVTGKLELRREALALGFDAFVSKGDPPETLLAAIQACSNSSNP